MQNQSPLPDRIKQARTSAGISQKELGIRLGIEPSSASGRMNHYEKGRHTPDYATLKRMAEELGVPVAFFFCESDSTAELLCLLEKLTEKDKRRLIKQLRSDSDE